MFGALCFHDQHSGKCHSDSGLITVKKNLIVMFLKPPQKVQKPGVRNRKRSDFDDNSNDGKETLRKFQDKSHLFSRMDNAVSMVTTESNTMTFAVCRAFPNIAYR